MQLDVAQKPKTFIVINPVAGSTEPESAREKIAAAFEEKGFPTEFYETKGDDDFNKIVGDALQKGCQLVVTSGGDGTLSGVIGGLIGSDVPLLILPSGTWNALAQALDIPIDLDNALELLFNEHQIKAIDAMKIDKRYFVLSVSAGVGSRTMEDVKREEKRRFGRFADLWKAINYLLEFHSHRFELKIDGQETRFRASELMVANSSILGLKILRLDKNIHMDDGKVNVCRIYANTVGEYLRLAWSMLRGDQQHNWNILCVEAAKEVEITCRERLPVQGDGDLIGHLPVKVTVHPKSVHIIAPVDAQT